MQKIILLIMVFMIATILYPQNPCPGTPTITYAGKTYNTVKISTQCWLKENLDVGTMISSSNPADSMRNNSIIEKYCYDNNPNNCATYGGLYLWSEAMEYITTPGTKGICPDGWHIPTKAEFEILATVVNNDSDALKAIGQGFGTNTSGFSAMLAGYRNYGGGFFNLGSNAFFLSSTEIDAMYESNIGMDDRGSNFAFNTNVKTNGFCVRCLKDESSTAVEGDNEKGFSTEYTLSQNYPNPFNPRTIINYSVPKASFVTIKVYDVLGKEVFTILNENKPVGNYSVDFDASKLVSGLYFYQLQSGNFLETKKFVLLK
jgi:uncharacterized protein (TIGR02145 family)